MPTESGSRYRVLRPLGRGAMGSVDLVYDAELERAVARKRIREVTPANLLRFKREFRALASACHHNLVRLHELGEDQGGPYFTMEAIEGVDIGAFSASGPDPAQIAGVVRQ